MPPSGHKNLTPYQRANPFEEGNAVAVKHGAYATLQLAPRAAELRDEIATLVPAGTPSDAPAITLLAWQLARIERANAHLDEHGLLDGDGVPAPVLKVLSVWENSAARLLDQLGMTPTSRARLGLDITRARGAALADYVEHHGEEGEQ